MGLGANHVLPTFRVQHLKHYEGDTLMRQTLWVRLFICFSLALTILFPRPLLAGASVSPTSLSFGSVTMGAASAATPANVVVSNPGRQTLSLLQVSSSLPTVFVVSGPALPLTLGPHSSVVFQVAFQPAAAGNYSGIIAFTTDARNNGNNNVLTVGVSGTATAAATSTQTYLLNPSTTALNFGNTVVGASSSGTVSLANTGTSSVNISQVTYTGSGFTVSGFSGAVTLAPGQSLPISVTFAPASVGSVTGSLNVVSNAAGSPVTIALSGTGVQPAIAMIPSSVSFTNVTVGVTNTQTVTITNPGTANLTISQASLVGAGFSYSGLVLPLTIQPGGSSRFTVGFTPSSAGSFSASLLLNSNAPTSPLSASLSGTGTSPILTLSASPTSLSFATVNTGSVATQTVTLTNTGNSAVSISQVGVSGSSFSATGITVPLSLAAGQSTSFSVIFAPNTTGSLSGTITIASNASNSPTAINVSGSGASSGPRTVTLNWTPGTTTYASFKIFRSTVSGGPYAEINSSLTPSFPDTNVTSGQAYYYVVTEVDSSGAESAYSNEAAATLP